LLVVLIATVVTGMVATLVPSLTITSNVQGFSGAWLAVHVGTMLPGVAGGLAVLGVEALRSGSVGASVMFPFLRADS
jgi:hypothetical protein